eukprot:TRINITY_DN876_c3_g1_i1.p1 TRINITY_DN876_c3_g1~~TRINITY_DN876_c3_g1_i1.p1  ORF type:complete len:309 (-),score=45.38 TRINITY_DN876_c3_g1_i1:129-1055(-)
MNDTEALRKINAQWTSAFALLNIVAYAIFGWILYRMHAYKTKSERLIVGLSLAGIIQPIGAIMYFYWISNPLQTLPLCEVVGFIYGFGDITYSLWAATLSIYLLTKGVFRIDHPLLEFLLGLFSFGLGLAVSLSGLGAEGRDETLYGPVDGYWCWIPDVPEFMFSRIDIHHMWLWIPYVIVIFNAMMALLRFLFLKNTMLNNTAPDHEKRADQLQNLLTIIRSMAPYILLFLILFFPANAFWISSTSGSTWSPSSLIFANCFMLSTGIGNLVIFLCLNRNWNGFRIRSPQLRFKENPESSDPPTTSPT